MKVSDVKSSWVLAVRLCRENLAFAAHLKLARRAFPGKRRKLIVDDALDILQLNHVQVRLHGNAAAVSQDLSFGHTTAITAGHLVHRHTAAAAPLVRHHIMVTVNVFLMPLASALSPPTAHARRQR